MNKRWISLGLAVLLATMAVLPVVAAAETADLAGPQDWPILGPILKLLGIGETEEVVIEVATEGLPEYRIETLDDAKQLEDTIAIGEHVRIVASEDAVNNIIDELITASDVTEVDGKVSFATNLVKAEIVVSMDFLADVEFELPVFKNADALEIELSTDISADSCAVTFDLDKVKINNWSFGLRGALEPTINNRIPDEWPYELVCVEKVIISDGEIAVEGFRVSE